MDDLSCILMAKFCVHTRFRADSRLKRNAAELVDHFVSLGTVYSLYSALLVASKLLDNAEQIAIIDKTFNAWRNSFWLGRTVAGMTPTCGPGTATAAQFVELLKTAQNQTAQEVFDFHMQIQTKKSHALRLFKYAKAENPSYPQKLIHPKALIIKSMSENSDFKSEMKEIRKAHSALTRDPFYKAWGV
jgi:hypothetical protein